jgi:DNA-binding NarL/FixJ family response regulator
MCRALTVLCADLSPERLAEMKRATISVHWELVGGAASVSELLLQLEEFHPDVVVIHAGLGAEAVEAVRRLNDRVRIVTVGDVGGADEHAESLQDVREAIMGLPSPGGPVRS